MDLIEQIDELMRQSKISPSPRYYKAPEVSFDTQMLQYIYKAYPSSLFHSTLQTSLRDSLRVGHSQQFSTNYDIPTSKTNFRKIEEKVNLRPDFAEEVSNSLDKAVAQLLMPVKHCFKNQKFQISLTRPLGKFKVRELEAEIGDFYLHALTGDQSRGCPDNRQINFVEVQVFTYALCKYLIDLYKLPQYGTVSTCQSRILRATAIDIPYKQLIFLVKAEYKLAKISRKEDTTSLQQYNPTMQRATSAKYYRRTSYRLFLEHKSQIAKIEKRREEQLQNEIEQCTFEPVTNFAKLGITKATDLGISQFLDKRQYLRKADKDAQILALLENLQDEARFFRLYLSNGFIEDVTEDLYKAPDISAQKQIVRQLSSVFHYKYLELQKAENRNLIKQGRVQRIKTDFGPQDTILLSEQRLNRVEDVQTNLELHRLQKQILINEELERSKRLLIELEERQDRAQSRARLAKTGMKGGGAIYGQLNDKLNIYNTVSDAAEAVRNVSKGGVVTLYSAAGNAKY